MTIWKPHVAANVCICCEANGLLSANSVSGTPWIGYRDFNAVTTDEAVLSCS